jgi:hypothetical protein
MPATTHAFQDILQASRKMAELKHTYDAFDGELFVADMVNLRKIETTLKTRIGIQISRQEHAYGERE